MDKQPCFHLDEGTLYLQVKIRAFPLDRDGYNWLK